MNIEQPNVEPPGDDESIEQPDIEPPEDDESEDEIAERLKSELQESALTRSSIEEQGKESLEFWVSLKLKDKPYALIERMVNVLFEYLFRN